MSKIIKINIKICDNNNNNIINYNSSKFIETDTIINFIRIVIESINLYNRSTLRFIKETLKTS